MKMEKENAVQKILLEQWDPIGVKKNPNAASEYESYALQITGMLVRGVSRDQLISYLNSVVTNDFEMTIDKQNTEKVAEMLLQLRRDF